jgi:prepilin-type N-terminal cleavage/methylation domain-containing protein
MTFSARQIDSGKAARASGAVRRGFTLIELILVMALLTVVISLTAPRLSRFFRGRTLDSEARRLLALTRSGQSRAVSEGIPIDLWVNVADGQVGLEAEPSLETSDSKAVDLQIDERLKLEVEARVAAAPATTMSRRTVARVASLPRVQLAHAELPAIRFLPDGSIGESSPIKLRLTGADGESLWLAQAQDGLAYEIRSTDQPNDTSSQAIGPGAR